jgi:hypothetical protein
MFREKVYKCTCVGSYYLMFAVVACNVLPSQLHCVQLEEL